MYAQRFVQKPDFFIVSSIYTFVAIGFPGVQMVGGKVVKLGTLAGTIVFHRIVSRALNQARTLLAPYRERAVWLKALDKYATLPSDVRIFSLNGRGGWNTDVSSYVLRERLGLFQGILA